MAQIQCLKCSKVCKSLQGWKSHMSGAHGGYDDAELNAAVGGGASQDVRSRMNAFADGLPGGEPPKTDGSPQEIPTQPPQEKRIKATPKKLKKILGDIPAKILESNGINLDEEDKEAMEEAAEFMAGIFGVEFAIPESRYVVQSRFIAVLWVVGVTGLVWLKHRMPQLWSMMSADTGKAKDAQPKKQNGSTDKVQ